MSMIQEFKEFAMRGNVVDLAVGVVIGAAFGKIVSSLVGDLLMPILGLLIGNINFSDLAIILKAAEPGHPAVLLGYGKFIQSIFDFLIIAIAIFAMVKLINTLTQRKKEAAGPTPTEALLTEIRDLLKSRA
jgi:large conductance mechanosensitive channel